MRIPLLAPDDSAVGYALVDKDDRALAAMRWRLHTKGYAQGTAKPKPYMHRLVVERRLGRSLDSAEQVHGPGGKLDNHYGNLTLCSSAFAHKAEHFPDGGVRWDAERKRWIARPTIDGRRIFLGRHSTRDAALTAVQEARHAATGTP